MAGKTNVVSGLIHVVFIREDTDIVLQSACRNKISVTSFLSMNDIETSQKAITKLKLLTKAKKWD